jgi:hypothetical protein
MDPSQVQVDNPHKKNDIIDNSDNNKKRIIIQLRIVNFIKKWIEYQPILFAEGAEMGVLLRSFVDKIRNSSLKVEQDFAKILTNALLNKEYRQPDLSVAPKSYIPKGTSQSINSLVEISAVEMARQITLGDHAMLRKILPSEFLNKAWEKGNEHAPNLYIMNQNMDRVS